MVSRVRLTNHTKEQFRGAQALSAYLDMAVLEELGLVKTESEDNDIFKAVGLSSEQAGKIIAAARLPLVGWQTPVEPEWLKVSAPDAHRIDITRNGWRPSGNRVNINWWCSPDYVGKSKYGEWGNTDFSTRCTYRFLVDGSLVRTSTRDMITLAHVERDVAIRIRAQGDQTAVTPDVAVAAMAALLHDFGELYLSLSRTTHAGLSRQLFEVERVAQRLARLLEGPELKVLRGIGSEAFALANKNFSKKIRLQRLLARKHPKKRNARVLSMGPLQTCFRLLFGARVTSHRKLVGTNPSYRADGPFIRFAHAFFKEVGCACAMDTVHGALCEWRNSEAKRHRFTKAKNSDCSS